MTQPIEVTYVVPRYGPDVIGGAESAARMLAENLVALTAAKVRVLTTTAQEMDTWENEYSAGREFINGVQVDRFRTDQPRARSFAKKFARALRSPKMATPEMCDDFIQSQGPMSRGLIEAISQVRTGVVAFYPYLYAPTVYGARVAHVPMVMHPAAHDEPPLHLGIFDATFGAMDGFVYHTGAERECVEARFQVAHMPAIELGMGFAPPSRDMGSITEKLGLRGRPYLLALGRVEVHKGSLLIDHLFYEYKLRHPGSDLALVIAGPQYVKIGARESVFLTGAVSESDKADLLAHAMCLVQPSALESFAIVLLEAWNAGLPVLVNGACAPMLELSTKSQGGLSFTDYETFERDVELLSDSPSLRSQLAQRGILYSDMYFTWPRLIARYTAFLSQVQARATVGISGK